MSDKRNPRISSRKQPQQARSSELVASILEAAVQVLASEGAQRFTTARVAERAGVSIGSLYQYFPNKAAILFRLQSDEWRRTTRLLGEILEDTAWPPLARLRRLVLAFVRSEHHHPRRGRQAVLRTAAQRGGDRALRRGPGRYALRLSRRPWRALRCRVAGAKPSLGPAAPGTRLARS